MNSLINNDISRIKSISKEEKYAKVVPGLLKRIKDIYMAIYDRFGDEGLELIKDVSAMYGRNLGLNAKKRMTDNGIKNVGLYLVRIFEMVGGKWEITSCNENEMIIKIQECPYPFTDDKVCRAHTSMEKTLVQTLNPSLSYEIRRSIPQGNNACEHVIKKQ